jgi:hypothetical protein
MYTLENLFSCAKEGVGGNRIFFKQILFPMCSRYAPYCVLNNNSLCNICFAQHCPFETYTCEANIIGALFVLRFKKIK